MSISQIKLMLIQLINLIKHNTTQHKITNVYLQMQNAFEMATFIWSLVYA